MERFFGTLLCTIGFLIIVFKIELGGYQWAISLLCLGIGGIIANKELISKHKNKEKNQTKKKEKSK